MTLLQILTVAAICIIAIFIILLWTCYQLARWLDPDCPYTSFMNFLEHVWGEYDEWGRKRE